MLKQLRLMIMVLTLLLAWAPASQAHDVPPSAMLLDIGTRTTDVELQMPLSELSAAMELPLANQPQQLIPTYGAQLQQYLLQHLRFTDATGKAYSQTQPVLSLSRTANQNWTSNDWLNVKLQLLPPQGGNTNTLNIDCDLIIHRVITHNLFVSVRHDFGNAILGELKLMGLIGFQQTHLKVDSSGGSWWRGFKGVFDMGMQHIAEGTDHLLFLLVLLLPAGLAVRQSRWQGLLTLRQSLWGICKTVSGFTLGHSITLAAAATGLIHAPSQVVEVLIALSIMVSALHAWRPLFPGKETWIAAGFGLVHGLAFASTLSGFNYDSWVLASSLLGFNLGIEAMQLIVVLALLPLLLLLSRHPRYAALRTLLASCSFIAAAAWVAQRALNMHNPVEPMINAIATHAWQSWLVIATLTSLTCLKYLKQPEVTQQS